MDDRSITPDVAANVLSHYGYGGYPGGGFTQSLLEAFVRADRMNRAKLGNEYPGYYRAVTLLADTEDGTDRLREVLETGKAI